MYYVTAKELKKALKDIKKAEKNGFMYCEAVFKPIGIDMAFTILEYSDIIEKAHPTNSKFNWGRFQGVSRIYKFKNNKLIKVKK